MMCPYCLHDASIASNCSNCNEDVPALYVSEYRRFPPVVVSAVGFREHGKTVYFASLFYTLKKMQISRYWEKFYELCLTDACMDTVYQNVSMLEKGDRLPDATPQNFPRPTMIRFAGVPKLPNSTLLFYDTGGEVFERSRSIGRYASFVAKAGTVMMLFSIRNLSDTRTDLHRLANTYINGMSDIGGDTRQQNLVVVYTKGDQLVARFNAEWADLREYLTRGTVAALADSANYVSRLREVSIRLERFTRADLGAGSFVALASNSFKSVSYCVVSALGSEPERVDDRVARLTSEVAPRRILDPLLLVLNGSKRRIWYW